MEGFYQKSRICSTGKWKRGKGKGVEGREWFLLIQHEYAVWNLYSVANLTIKNENLQDSKNLQDSISLSTYPIYVSIAVL